MGEAGPARVACDGGSPVNFMQNPSPAAYQCPSCGVLAQAEAGGAGEMVCGACGFEFRKPVRVAPRGTGGLGEASGKFVQRDVAVQRRVQVRERVISSVAPVLVVASGEARDDGEGVDSSHRREVVLEDGRRKVMKRRRSSKAGGVRYLRFLGWWIVAAVIGVFVVREVITRDEVPLTEDGQNQELREQMAKSAEARTFISQQFPACWRVMLGYFEARNTAQRSQFVRDPIRVTSRMAVYESNHLPRRLKGNLQLLMNGLRMEGSQQVIEAIFQDESGERYEVAFVRDGGEWRIDWEHLVRWSAQLWYQFMERTEGAEAEFRLYVRRRQVSLGDEDLVAVQFYPPVDEDLNRQRGASDRVLVRRDSESGQRLERLWERTIKDPGRGGTMFPVQNPPNLARVRVVLAWTRAEDGELYLTLKELRAVNWSGEGLDDGLGAGEEIEGAEGAEGAEEENGDSEVGEEETVEKESSEGA